MRSQPVYDMPPPEMGVKYQARMDFFSVVAEKRYVTYPVDEVGADPKPLQGSAAKRWSARNVQTLPFAVKPNIIDERRTHVKPKSLR